jgi:hypothetical protein
MTLTPSIGCAAIAMCATGCGAAAPMTPSPVATPSTLSLEAEAGIGTGDRMERTSASGGVTIHLAPGQRREWTFTIPGPGAEYRVMVRYSNDETGESEVLTVAVDGAVTGVFRARDTGDDGVGWNTFVSERAGDVALTAGSHRLSVESAGGDGCVEIDGVTLVPKQAAAIFR